MWGKSEKSDAMVVWYTATYVGKEFSTRCTNGREVSESPPDSVIAGSKVKLGPFKVGKVFVGNLGIFFKVLVVLIEHGKVDLELFRLHDFIRRVTDGMVHVGGRPAVGRVVRDGEL